MTAFQTSDVNFNTLANQLTPIALRRPVWTALMQALLKPIRTIGNDYNTFRRLKRRRMDYNGQVRLLENIINQLMVGDYDMDDPVIYLDDPTPIEEFIISPNGNWMMQNSIHYDLRGKEDWDHELIPDVEPPEDYSILYDHASRTASLGFEVHLTPPLDEDAPSSEVKTKFYNNGGTLALRDIVDTYKLAGKRYVIIQDEE